MNDTALTGRYIATGIVEPANGVPHFSGARICRALIADGAPREAAAAFVGKLLAQSYEVQQHAVIYDEVMP